MNEVDMCHIMIDIETLGTKSNSVILSVGAVQFDLRGNVHDRYHKGIEIQSCLDIGMEVDGYTIEWWLKQKHENIARLMSIDCLPLKTVLLQLYDCFVSMLKPITYVWSHGSSFDLVLLENAYKAAGWKGAWWKYSNVRDTRTLFDLANYEYIAKGGHDALEDAKNQAKAVQEAYQKLKGGNMG